MDGIGATKKATSGKRPEAAGDNKRASSIVDSYYRTIPLCCQPPPFDHDLSLQLDQAMSECGLCRTAYLETWALSQRLAADALRLAELSDWWRAEVIRLEAQMPDQTPAEMCVSGTLESDHD